MDTLLIRARYRITYVVHCEPHCVILRAVDIESRDKRELLLCTYDGPLLREYLPGFKALRHCPEFEGLFIEDDSLVTVFSFREDPAIDEVFYRGVAVPWRERILFAQQLFHRALELTDAPPFLSCAAFLSENLRVSRKNRALYTRYAVKPVADASARELTLLVSDQVGKVLPRRWDSPAAEHALLDTLARGEFTSPVALYGYWASVKPALEAEYAKAEAMSAMPRFLHYFFLNLRRLFRKKR